MASKGRGTVHLIFGTVLLIGGLALGGRAKRERTPAIVASVAGGVGVLSGLELLGFGLLQRRKGAA